LISHEKCFRASEIWLITFQVVFTVIPAEDL
jgi:hypothetical protein